MIKRLRKRALMPLIELLNDIVVEIDTSNDRVFELQKHVNLDLDFRLMITDSHYLRDIARVVWSDCAMRQPIHKYSYDDIILEARYRINQLKSLIDKAMGHCSFGDECANAYLYDYTQPTYEQAVKLGERLDTVIAQILTTPEMKLYFNKFRKNHDKCNR